MCGITGWINWEADLTRQGHILEKMVETLSRRGPDAAGVWLSPRAAVGHRRLIVVDPEGGSQPMTRRLGERACTITYNGELYNAPELRRELESRGHRFYTRNSDTEALLLAYMEWGTACVERLNGIFAFAVWDEAGQSLFLARDRLGVKPLFYAVRGSSFLFGSELKALLAHPAVKPEVDEEGLAEVFAVGPSRTPGHAVYRGIAELRPGCCLVFARNGLRLRRYWALESHPHPDDFETTVATVRELFMDAVERQLVSDVPVCTFLSGGLDSSAIAAVAAGAFRRKGLGKLRTYSVDYTGNDRFFRPDYFQPNSDAWWTGRVADCLGTSHHVVEIDTPELIEALVPALLANDLPGMADIDSSLYLFCREIKKGATVALSGESADEVFGGYPWFYDEEALAAGTFPWIRKLRERVQFLSPELAGRIKPEEYVAERYQEALAEVPRLPGETPFEARLREMFYLNITRFMQMLLDRKDRMSMAAGLEVRVPFCDHRLVEYVWNIPWEMKSCDGMAKGILRRALSGILPEEVLRRRKSPYPKTHNPAYLAAVRSLVLRLLDDPGSPLLPLINVEAVREAALSGSALFDRPWFSQLMGDAQFFAYLIQVDAWLRNYGVTIR
ncbi:asparagine synthase [Pelotomaculum thermopropionicum SI]|uniref:asparagine synthase (glutamine-hydrolyzing) n=1 Tax=Pelotomaculum thermopropionicum (strain DSM 13744 / JCM 10971 / SI) TaxID=370438 RepID=A5D4J4_PELTS|nr:asparagine synthase [Pelotomaculum thermopropionicum SI]